MQKYKPSTALTVHITIMVATAHINAEHTSFYHIH